MLCGKIEFLLDDLEQKLPQWLIFDKKDFEQYNYYCSLRLIYSNQPWWTPTGIYFQDKMDIHSEIYAWCRQNCEESFLLDDLNVLFKSSDDFNHFMLRWL